MSAEMEMIKAQFAEWRAEWRADKREIWDHISADREASLARHRESMGKIAEIIAKGCARSKEHDAAYERIEKVEKGLLNLVEIRWRQLGAQAAVGFALSAIAGLAGFLVAVKTLTGGFRP